MNAAEVHNCIALVRGSSCTDLPHPVRAQGEIVAELSHCIANSCPMEDPTNIRKGVHNSVKTDDRLSRYRVLHMRHMRPLLCASPLEMTCRRLL